MKSEFSTSWNSSVQPRKQRKYNYNAPLHLKHKFLSAHLSKDLRKKHGKRSLPLRKGDEVLIMRGSFSGKKGKITSVDLKNSVVNIEGMQRSKRDGSKVNVPFHPSKLMIHSLTLDDKRRLESLNRKHGAKPAAKTSPKETSHKPSKETKHASN